MGRTTFCPICCQLCYLNFLIHSSPCAEALLQGGAQFHVTPEPMPFTSHLASSEAAAKARRIAGKSLFTLGSSLASAGVGLAKAAAAGYQTLTADRSDREKVTWARVGQLEWRDPGQGSLRCLPVVLVGYDTGFQVWSLEDKDAPSELSSIRRDGAVRWLEAVPQPRCEDPPDGLLHGTRPLIAVVPAPAPAGNSQELDGSSSRALPQQHRVQLFSLRTQGFVKTLSFGSEVLAVLCSSRVMVVALQGQLQVFDAVTLDSMLSCLTYTPPPASRQLQPQHAEQQGQRALTGHRPHESLQEAELPALSGSPCALGPRWLAYAADQPVQQSGRLAKAQRLPLHRRNSSSGSHSSASSAHAMPGRAPSLEPGSGGFGNGTTGGVAIPGTSPGAGLSSAVVAEAAREVARKSGQQLAAAGSASYKYLSSQYRSWRSGVQQQGVALQQGDTNVAGTVMVRDVVTRQVVCHFRAHTSPLAAMQFTPDGTMVATASVAGHNVNIFRIVPPSPTGQAYPGVLEGEPTVAGSGALPAGYAVHLFRLHRGMTPAVIQAITFAPDASWAAVTSGRGTSHVFHLAAVGAGSLGAGGTPGLQHLVSQGQPAGAYGAGAAAAAGVAVSGAGLQGMARLRLDENVAQQQQQEQVEEGVAGQGSKLLAVGRAGGKAGLLGSGMAGAAAQAALSMYWQQSGVLPAAAAFVPVKPVSPRALAGTHQPSSEAGPLALVVVNWEGQLTRHALRTADASRGIPAAAPVNGHYPAAVDGSGPPAAADTRQVATLQEEARWDICRQHGWPEREEMPACLLPLQQLLGHAAPAIDIHSTTSSVLGSPQGSLALPPLPAANGFGSGIAADAAGAAATELVSERGCAAAPVDPSWLVQAEGASASQNPAGLPASSVPLWADPQFRFYALPSQPGPGQQPLLQQAAPAPLASWASTNGHLGDLASIQTSLGHVRSDSGALLGSSPLGGTHAFLASGTSTPTGLANGFGGHFGRSSSSLSSTPPY